MKMVMTDIETKLRPFTFEDAQACVDLFNACSQRLNGCDDSELDDLISEWTSPGLDASKMIQVVEDRDGQVIGYIDVWDITSPYVVKWVWGVLHPDHWDDGLYSRMLSWAEDLARERIALAPDGARVIMKQGTDSKDKQRKHALGSYGFDLVRHFYRMQIELDRPPQAPKIPKGLRITPIDMEKELEEAILAMDEAFQDHWGHVSQPKEELLEQWAHFLENDKDFDPALWFLAKEGDQIAGICRCSGKTVEDPDMGWVNQLCVRQPWRRRGLGMAMLLAAFNTFYERGKARAALAVDASSLTNATKLYEKAGMHVTRQHDIYEKELRQGREIATQEI
jgi:GNAT superfamily N-acetyltransferase